jgi:hypothetical protein
MASRAVRDRVAAALADVVVEERHGPWSIISANTGESGPRPREPSAAVPRNGRRSSQLQG